MNQYPDAVAAIASDYLERVKSQLGLLPALERDDFLREVGSHVHDAYDQTSGEDDVVRILAVLRNFGEPAEVVSDRLPNAMVRSGAGRKLPLYIVGGILIALFGLPLGFGGFGVLVGLLAALAGLLIAFYAVAGGLLLSGAMIMLLGLTRVVVPGLWDRLVMLGYVHMDGPVGEFLQSLSPSDEGVLLMLFASAFLAVGWGMVRMGKSLLAGLRFLFGLTFDWLRGFAKKIRQRLNQNGHDGFPADRAAPSMPLRS